MMTTLKGARQPHGSRGRLRFALGLGTLITGALVTGMSATACSGADSPTEPTVEIPVRRVVLYQNGVGYFERVGKVDGDVLTLQVRPSQINDLLKSLTVIDSGTGRAVSVSLPLEENADRILNELPEQVRDAGGLLHVLRLFRGAHVVVSGEEGTLTGRVIGVENLQDNSGKEVSADWRLSVKTEDGEIAVYPVKDIHKVELHDKTLSAGLERSLDVSLGEGGWKPIALSIRLAGAESHELLASYIVEMPRWKSAYRLVLDKDQKPLLQGWAVVDNVSGESWDAVQLSLVSGTPISFKYNLHAPQYAERVDLTPAHLPRAAAPPPSEAPGVDRDGLEKRYAKSRAVAADSSEGYEMEDESAAYPEEAPMGSAAGAATKPMAPAPAPSVSAQRLEESSVSAEAAQVGALFRYDIADPVTIPDRSSTLVSIVNKRVDGEEVVYFRPELTWGYGQPTTNPYRAVKFANTTGFTLETGPITVYSSGTFVGEGFVERMESDETSFLTFAIDGKVSMETEAGTRDEGLRLVRIVDGTILSESQRIERTTYKVENRHDKPIKAFIRTPKRAGWKLLHQPTGTVDTPEAFIAPVTVPAGKTQTLDVEWAQELERTLEIDSGETDQLLQLTLNSGKVPPAIAQKLQEFLSAKTELSDLRRQEANVRERHNLLSNDQNRVRANLDTLRKTTGNQALKTELATKLAKLEADLGELSGELVRISEKTAELEARLTAILRGVTLVPAK